MSNKRGWKSTSAKEMEADLGKRSRRGMDYISPEVKQFTTKDGTHAIRLVPPLSDDPNADSIGFDISTHFVEGEGYLLCPATWGKRDGPCPICQEGSRVRAQDPESGRDFRASRRTLIWLIDYSTGEEGDLKVWAPPISLIEQFTRAARNIKTGALQSLNDPEDGHVVWFERVPKGGKFSNYENIQLDPDTAPLDPSILDDQCFFADILIKPDPIQLEAARDALLQTVGAGTNGGSRRPAEEEPVVEGPPQRSRREFSRPVGGDAEGPPEKAAPKPTSNNADRIRQRLADLRKAREGAS